MPRSSDRYKPWARQRLSLPKAAIVQEQLMHLWFLLTSTSLWKTEESEPTADPNLQAVSYLSPRGQLPIKTLTLLVVSIKYQWDEPYFANAFFFLFLSWPKDFSS